MNEWWNVPCRLTVDRYMVFASPDGGDLVADLLRPQTEELLAGMVVIAGGGWRTCNKRNLEPISTVLASWGYVTFNVSYRVVSQARWPACMQDVKTAVRWLRAHAAEYGLDPARIGAFGNSAGAHLAAMLAVTPADENFGGTEYPDQPSNVQAAVCMATPTDMAAQYELHENPQGPAAAMLGGTPQEAAEAYRAASPIHHVSADSAPIFFVHGEQDELVPIGPAREMSRRLRELGIDSPFDSSPEFGHSVKDYFYRKTGTSPAPRIRQFLARHLGKRK